MRSRDRRWALALAMLLAALAGARALACSDLNTARSTRWSLATEHGVSWLVTPCGQTFFGVRSNSRSVGRCDGRRRFMLFFIPARTKIHDYPEMTGELCEASIPWSALGVTSASAGHRCASRLPSPRGTGTAGCRCWSAIFWQRCAIPPAGDERASATARGLSSARQCYRCRHMVDAPADLRLA